MASCCEQPRDLANDYFTSYYHNTPFDSLSKTGQKIALNLLNPPRTFYKEDGCAATAEERSTFELQMAMNWSNIDMTEMRKHMQEVAERTAKDAAPTPIPVNSSNLSISLKIHKAQSASQPMSQKPEGQQSREQSPNSRKRSASSDAVVPPKKKQATREFNFKSLLEVELTPKYKYTRCYSPWDQDYTAKRKASAEDQAWYIAIKSMPDTSFSSYTKLKTFFDKENEDKRDEERARLEEEEQARSVQTERARLKREEGFRRDIERAHLRREEWTRRKQEQVRREQEERTCIEQAEQVHIKHEAQPFPKQKGPAYCREMLEARKKREKSEYDAKKSQTTQKVYAPLQQDSADNVWPGVPMPTWASDCHPSSRQLSSTFDESASTNVSAGCKQSDHIGEDSASQFHDSSAFRPEPVEYPQQGHTSSNGTEKMEDIQTEPTKNLIPTPVQEVVDKNMSEVKDSSAPMDLDLAKTFSDSAPSGATSVPTPMEGLSNTGLSSMPTLPSRSTPVMDHGDSTRPSPTPQESSTSSMVSFSATSPAANAASDFLAQGSNSMALGGISPSISKSSTPTFPPALKPGLQKSAMNLQRNLKGEPMLPVQPPDIKPPVVRSTDAHNSSLESPEPQEQKSEIETGGQTDKETLKESSVQEKRAEVMLFGMKPPEVPSASNPSASAASSSTASKTDDLKEQAGEDAPKDSLLPENTKDQEVPADRRPLVNSVDEDLLREGDDDSESPSTSSDRKAVINASTVIVFLKHILKYEAQLIPKAHQKFVSDLIKDFRRYDDITPWWNPDDEHKCIDDISSAAEFDRDEPFDPLWKHVGRLSEDNVSRLSFFHRTLQADVEQKWKSRLDKLTEDGLLDLLHGAMLLGLHPKKCFSQTSQWAKRVIDCPHGLNNKLLDDTFAFHKLRYDEDDDDDDDDDDGVSFSIRGRSKKTRLLLDQLISEGTLTVLQEAVEDWFDEVLFPDGTIDEECLEVRKNSFEEAFHHAGLCFVPDNKHFESFLAWVRRMGGNAYRNDETVRELFDVLMKAVKYRYPRSWQYNATTMPPPRRGSRKSPKFNENHSTKPNNTISKLHGDGIQCKDQTRKELPDRLVLI